MNGIKLGGPELSFRDLLLNRMDFLGVDHIDLGLYDFEKFKLAVGNKCVGIESLDDKRLIFKSNKPTVVTVKSYCCCRHDNVGGEENFIEVPINDDVLKDFFDEASYLMCRNKVTENLKVEREQEWQNKITTRMEEEDLI